LLSSLPSEAFFVAILGRPNVGKSSLFNRLLGRQLAITDPTPGVTRDAVAGEMRIRDRLVRLLDTGGYTRAEGGIERQVARRSLAAAEGCGLALLLVEVGGLTREDYELVDQLRRAGGLKERLVLVVNKVDGPKQELAVGEFHALGFSRLLAVSAAHGRGIAELKELIYEAAARAGTEPALPAGAPDRGEELRLAILGKPNTGKSTLLNRLLGEERALVSETPGTTRDPVSGRFLYRGKPLEVVDTAGIRRKSRVEEAVEYYSVNRAIRCISEADVVLLLLDAREGVADQDKKIASLAVREGRGVVLVLNKSDLVEDLRQERKGIEERVRFFFPTLEFAPLVTISARTGYGVAKLLAETLEVGRQLKQQVATGRLNLAVKHWVAAYALPVRGKNVKIRYATQTSANPVRFLFFVNTLRLFPARYLQYLKNRIRADLGFDKVPVDLQLRES
jgi:GTP-binding protein